MDYKTSFNVAKSDYDAIFIDHFDPDFTKTKNSVDSTLLVEISSKNKYIVVFITDENNNSYMFEHPQKIELYNYTTHTRETITFTDNVVLIVNKP